MTKINHNLQALNEVWRNSALEDFIKRMLVYFDPMNLIVLGAPQDEYDDDISKIKALVLQEDITLERLSNGILSLYKSQESDLDIVKKKSERMAEDLLDLKNG